MKTKRMTAALSVICIVFMLLCGCRPNFNTKLREFVTNGYYIIETCNPGTSEYTCTGFADGCFNDKVELPTSEISGGFKLHIGEGAFANTAIKEVCVFSYYTYHSASIYEYAFYGCSELKTVKLKHIYQIERYAFAYCAEGLEVTIYDTYPPFYLPSEAFLIYGQYDDPIFRYDEDGWNAFEGIEDFSIFVPAEAVEKYKTALGWRLYADHIFAIEE